ncbi:hypothetical protein M422DRAFT_784561 [Sphaerobolus stellatus SS14]|uniref:Uncharacterized protein n=1 Tax=Sphaerobolus stellatus (strain SS14) TaxID=990650 RepID=A0A0C9TGH1_SPHS4|nr:hypothetical protein M422DRAFT_784561 [Sphaerobolus stellatus SS14]
MSGRLGARLPPVPPSEEDIEERLELDYQIGEDLTERIIPRATDWFTGKALEYEDMSEDDGGFEMDDNEEKEDDDDDNDEVVLDSRLRRRLVPRPSSSPFYLSLSIHVLFSPHSNTSADLPISFFSFASPPLYHTPHPPSSVSHYRQHRLHQHRRPAPSCLATTNSATRRERKRNLPGRSIIVAFTDFLHLFGHIKYFVEVFLVGRQVSSEVSNLKIIQQFLNCR